MGFAVKVNAQTTLSVGDIQVLGVTADDADSFSFVIWKDIASGTVIRFTEKSFADVAGTTVVSGESDMSITFSSSLSAGTVVRAVDAGSSNSTVLVNGGALVGTSSGSLSGLAAGGDQVFAYQGAAVGTTTFTGTLLYGFNIGNSDLISTGTATTNNSYLPTAISFQDANIDIGAGNNDNADYDGARSGMTTAAYRAAVANLDNIDASNSRSDLSTGGFTIANSVSLHWDANGTTAGDGGTGTWDTTTQSRFKNGAAGTTYLHWVNSTAGNDHIAVFGGTAGTVSVAASGVTTSGLQFDVDGYSIQSNIVTLFGTAPSIAVTNGGHTATITSTLAGSNGMTKTGAGTLELTAANSYSGTTTVSEGTLKLTSSSSNNTIANSNTIFVGESGTLDVSGISASGGFQVQSGQTLSGNGVVTGDTTIKGGGIVTAGTSGNTTFTDPDLDFTGNLTVGDAGSATWLVDLVGGGSSSCIVGDAARALPLRAHRVFHENPAGLPFVCITFRGCPIRRIAGFRTRGGTQGS